MSLYYAGVNNLPHRFEELYLARKFGEIRPYHINVNIGVTFKLLSLFSATGWEYYRWLDSFLDSFAQDFAFDRFLQDIGWNIAVTMATVTEHKRVSEVVARATLHTAATEDKGGPA